MTSLDPLNYSRESHGQQATIKARYAGRCGRCDEPTQATPRKTVAEATQAEIWVRCRDCGSVTTISKDGRTDR